MKKLEKYIPYLVLAILLIIIAKYTLKAIKDARIDKARKPSVNTSNLLRPDAYYTGLALRGYNSMKGLQWTEDDRQDFLGLLLTLNDDELKYVYSIFNRDYAKPPDTLRSWINDEVLVRLFDNHKSEVLDRFDKLGLG